MATQEDVLKAIVDYGGVMSFSDLKKYFKLPKTGSSWLPQRLKSLENKRLVFRIKVRETYYLVHPSLLASSGRPLGMKLSSEMEMKILKIIEKHGIINISHLRRELKYIKTKRLEKYLAKLKDKKLIIEKRTPTLRLFTTKNYIEKMSEEYYKELYDDVFAKL